MNEESHMISHLRLPTDQVLYWDFDVPPNYADYYLLEGLPPYPAGKHATR